MQTVDINMDRSIVTLGAITLAAYVLPAIERGEPYRTIGRRALAIAVVYAALLGLNLASPELAQAFAVLFAVALLLPMLAGLAELIEEYL